MATQSSVHESSAAPAPKGTTQIFLAATVNITLPETGTLIANFQPGVLHMQNVPVIHDGVQFATIEPGLNSPIAVQAGDLIILPSTVDAMATLAYYYV